MRLIAQPVHQTFFPYPIAATVHAARVSLAYQVNARSAARATGVGIQWGPYVVGYLVMTWGGTLWTHHILQIPPPMLYSTTPWIIYTSTHIILTFLTALFPIVLDNEIIKVLDTVLFPLDAMVRTGTVTSAVGLIAPTTPPALAPTALTHLLIGALASSGGTLTASTLSTWSATWSLTTPPILRAPTLLAFVLGSMDVWGGALVAAVYGVASGREEFKGVRGALGALGSKDVKEWRMEDLEARAVAAGLLAVCFGVRVYWMHWAGKARFERERVRGVKSEKEKTK
ncbi:hypothetical protein E4T56_gene8148 [Termitomyces sp. T112]|nr:hypothetical protein C0989_004023 [Termitomyces sp. Mn162]KAG5721781.1 hypothetical protein E4T56_gene8148 [Termitomyces sp. T112]KNZ75841.1 hypothetical protein J132_00854 [Termitomyces sp. J132]